MKQFAKLISRIIENLPELDREAMQYWIEMPLALKVVLSRLTIPHQWYEIDGVIYFSVTSDGTAGEDWINRLERKGCCVMDDAKQILLSSEFKPTNGVTTEVAVLRGTCWPNQYRTTREVRFEARKRAFFEPSIEEACLIREKLPDDSIEVMGFVSIITMHEPIHAIDGKPFLLCTSRSDTTPVLSSRYDRPGREWDRNSAFAFVASKS